MIEILLNGAPHQLAPGQNVAQLVASLGLTDQAIAVALERQVLARQRWNEHPVQPGAHIEIVRAIGGG